MCTHIIGILRNRTLGQNVIYGREKNNRVKRVFGKEIIYIYIPRYSRVWMTLYCDRECTRHANTFCVRPQIGAGLNLLRRRNRTNCSY